MKRFFLYTILSFFLLLPSAGQAPANSNDSIRLSLLTCAPGEEIYSLFGHTAIRYENPSQGIDVVFNYGLFSFNTPNFIFRFSLGETDYQLGVTDYEHFAAEYAFYGRSVWQQTLNLTDEEKTKLIQLLQENYRPENRVYRYNFFLRQLRHPSPGQDRRKALQERWFIRRNRRMVRALSATSYINIAKDIRGRVSASTSASVAKQTAPSRNAK